MQTVTPKTVDVIVPVYRGYEETLACIHSVLNSRKYNQIACNLIVIDDCSPEPKLSEALEALAEKCSLTLLKNTENLGFVGTVNRGMSQTQHDVILLNSDTEVANNWIDRLAFHSQLPSNGSVATVTPYSNNATLCSYPMPFADNELPPNETVSSMDKHCADANLGQSLVIPTGVGFCLFITRKSLNKIGFFDIDAFGKGYGEENDFCLRAIAQNFVNLHALDVFVWHKGSVSFSDSAIALQANAIRIIRERYPEYEAQIQSFIKEDPGKISRFNVALSQLKVPTLFVLESSEQPFSQDYLQQQLAPVVHYYEENNDSVSAVKVSLYSQGFDFKNIELSASELSSQLTAIGKISQRNVISSEGLSNQLTTLRDAELDDEKRVLHIVNNHGGGTLRYIESMAYYGESKNRHFVLYMGDKQQVLWDVWRNHYQLLNLCNGKGEWQTVPLLNQMLAGKHHSLAIHVHSMFGAGLAYAEALPSTFPVVATLHDHYFLTNQAFVSHKILVTPSHLNRVQQFLQRANKIIVPSQYLLEQAQPYFEQQKLQLIPHGVSKPQSALTSATQTLAADLMRLANWSSSKRTIAFIGAIGPHKGLTFIKKLIKRLSKRDYQVVILGYTADILTPDANNAYLQHGPYHHAEIPALIKYYGVDLVVFPPAIPESFCYALSDIYATVPVLAPRTGAFKYRIEQEKLGDNYPSNFSPRQLRNMIIKRFTHLPSTQAAVINDEASMVDMTEYCYIHVNGEDWQKQGFTHTDIDEFCTENLNEETLKQTLIHLARENHMLKQRIATLRNKNQLPVTASILEKMQYYRWRTRHYASRIVKHGVYGTVKKLWSKIRWVK